MLFHICTLTVNEISVTLYRNSLSDALGLIEVSVVDSHNACFKTDWVRAARDPVCFSIT